MRGYPQSEPHAFPGPFNQIQKDERMPWTFVLIVIVAYLAINLTIGAFRQAAADRSEFPCDSQVVEYADN